MSTSDSKNTYTVRMTQALHDAGKIYCIENKTNLSDLISALLAQHINYEGGSSNESQK